MKRLTASLFYAGSAFTGIGMLGWLYSGHRANRCIEKLRGPDALNCAQAAIDAKAIWIAVGLVGPAVLCLWLVRKGKGI